MVRSILRSGMNIQSVDFARQIKTRQESHRRPAAVPVGNAKPGVRKSPAPAEDKKGRAYGVFFSLSVLIFTVGLFAGLQLGQNRSFEESLAKKNKPSAASAEKNNKPKETLTSFANTGSGENSDEDAEASVQGSFIIKVGTYDPKEADELTTRINELPYFARLDYSGCKNVNETTPGREAAFRTRVEDSEQQNVFIGCFQTVEQAKDASTELRKEALPNTGSARLFEIE